MRIPKQIGWDLSYLNFRMFDSWVAKRIEDCDALVSLSGAGLKSGTSLHQRRVSLKADPTAASCP